MASTIFFSSLFSIIIGISLSRNIALGQSSDNLIVRTQNGDLLGKALNYSSPLGENRLNAWLGIPYAEKPIGNLRFKRPVPASNWNGVFDATKSPNVCYQPSFQFFEEFTLNSSLSEDCLYLNVFAPHPKPNNATVLVWIHGGAFSIGSSTSDETDPEVLVAEMGVIVVQIQYRLNIFGFLYLDGPEAPGNQGLLDQNLALTWVKDNIEQFGGNKDAITLFGVSAGGSSVSFHLLSPLSTDLFRNAIMQSGTANVPWALEDTNATLRNHLNFAQDLGCNGTSDQIVDCLSKFDSNTTLNAAIKYLPIWGSFPFGAPIVDNYFIYDKPANLVREGKFKKCPILLGINKDEGGAFVPFLFSPTFEKPAINSNNFRTYLSALFSNLPKFAVDSLIFRYTHWNNVENHDANIKNLIDAQGDYMFNCPAVDVANAYAKYNQAVYLYHYTHRTSQGFLPEWLGVGHGDEVSFVFGKPLVRGSRYQPSEQILSEKIIRYWTNFAKYQNPNEKTSTYSTPQGSALVLDNWPRFELINSTNSDLQRAYVNLNANKILTEYNLKTDICALWSYLLA